MNEPWSRRRLLKQFATLSATLALPVQKLVGEQPKEGVRENLEVQIATISPQTVRLTVLPVTNGKAAEIPFNGALLRESWGAPVARLHSGEPGQTIRSGNLRVHASLDPLSFTVSAGGV